MTLITICGHHYTLSYSDQVEDMHKIGISNLRRGTIFLRRQMPTDLEHSTLLHEVIHQIVDLHSINLPNDETTIDVIALALFQFIQANPEIVSYILSARTLEALIA